LAPVNAARREAIVTRITELLEQKYLLPDVGKKCGEHISQRLASGAYDRITDQKAFAKQLTTDLRGVSHDQHINVWTHAAERRAQQGVDLEVVRRESQERSRAGNFGFKKIEVRDGNVGYVDLREFSEDRDGFPTAVAAMNFLANADAIIVDLRNNNGGAETMVEVLSSYFLRRPTHLSSIDNRLSGSVTQSWSVPYVPGPSLADVPLFILTAGSTFSAGEAFAYNMKSLQRATIVGETTRGGAHAVEFFTVTQTTSISIPFATNLNALTGGNWEGVGVQPHVKCDAGDALEVAYEKAKEAAEKRRTYRRSRFDGRRALATRLSREADEAIQQGRAEDALRILTNVVTANPGDQSAWVRLIAMHHAVGDIEGIETALEYAMNIGAGDRGDINELGYYYLRSGNAALAVAVFTFNTKAFPNHYNVWDSLGEAHMEAGNREEAIRHYEQSLRLNPNSTNALKRLERLRG
jgi:tetratricopeptide (TPR) repeat protein